MLAPQSFEDWLEATFRVPISDDRWAWFLSGRGFEYPYDYILQHATSLFSSPRLLLPRFDKAEITQGFLYMGSELGCLRLTLESSISWDIRKEFVRSFFNLFDQLFVLDPFETTCFMWWDLLMIFGPPRTDNSFAKDAEVRQEVLAVLARILTIPSVECVRSALHGLGHMHLYAPDDAARVIRVFLASTKELDASIQEYADQCARGIVL